MDHLDWVFAHPQSFGLASSYVQLNAQLNAFSKKRYGTLKASFRNTHIGAIQGIDKLARGS
jgi:hypothetical protein